ncbi:aldehyde dehydrogenase family protein [Vitreoscilla massiliensis]|uniref:Aldehyde dehydrogenase family protein n=1 Tax=Vitreoscilla massiliensis TaxID=1689272 RepID=A0ABY4E2U3_9NEIS|nr:aldehyde dehydrogenase family protein [Vitreoscilla massiliensis]UOO89691.1 aldehyde dehydrogenase family protein [Vitreoscilla massiliensis]
MNTIHFPDYSIIAGKQVRGEGERIDIINPANEQVLSSISAINPAQFDAAVSAAQAAFPLWRDLGDGKRTELLLQAADVLEQHADEIATLITLEQGKVLGLAQFEMQGTLAWLRYTAGLQIPVDILEDSDSKRIELHHEPIGVVGSITPWNWPVMIAMWHMVAALKAGNVVINKPSEYTPLSTVRMVEVLNQVLPSGVLQAVVGKGDVGAAFSAHAGIQKMVFTGSTPTGQAIYKSGAAFMRPLTLELGGNDAAIVLPDVNVAEVAAKIYGGAFINGGQTCAALKRLYVHESIYAELTQALTDIADAVVLGDGMDANSQLGPVQNKMQFDKVNHYLQDALNNGARVLTQNSAKPESGYFIRPTIVVDIANAVALVREEQFGPVLPVVSYSSVDEAIAMANDMEFGLGGSVWSQDLAAAQTIAAQMQTGTVWINGHAEVAPHAPFGGWKLSGLGAEFGIDGLLANTRQKAVHVYKA